MLRTKRTTDAARKQEDHQEQRAIEEDPFWVAALHCSTPEKTLSPPAGHEENPGEPWQSVPLVPSLSIAKRG